MNAGLIKSQSCFSFHLDGDNEIDAGLLSKTISDMAELTKLAAQKEDPDIYLKMNVTAFRNGSFQIDFSTICEVGETLLKGSGFLAGTALTIVSVVKGIFEIKKHLKGELPKSIKEESENSISVENNLGQIISVPKSSGVVINNTQVDQLTVNISNYAKEHNPDGGFTFSAQDGTLKCAAEDVANISKHFPIPDEIHNCVRSRCETELAIKKADLIGRSQWEFIYNQRVIRANIDDEEFLEKIRNGATIKYGDYLKATVETFTDVDIIGKPVDGTEKYTIIKVHGNIAHDFDQFSF